MREFNENNLPSSFERDWSRGSMRGQKTPLVFHSEWAAVRDPNSTNLFSVVQNATEINCHHLKTQIWEIDSSI